MRAGKTIRLHRAALEKPKFDGAFDGDKRRFDNGRIVAGILEGLTAGEQATGLPQLEQGGVLDIEPDFDVRWTAIKCGLHLVDEGLDARTTHRRRPPCGAR